MKNVLVLGGGKVGKSVAELLLALGKGAYRVTLADREDANLKEARANLDRLKTKLPHAANYEVKKLDASDKAAVRAALRGQHYVVCMLPFDMVLGIAEIANELGVHYFDVTEDVETTDAVKKIADQGRAKVALVPQCGLAPGYIAIAGYEIARQFTEIHELTLRVRRSSAIPTNALHYNVTWSTAASSTNTASPATSCSMATSTQLPALEGLENFSFEGVRVRSLLHLRRIGSLIDTLVSEKKPPPNRASPTRPSATPATATS
jgi:saccharopine dehydrogenase-like NADP-dependent oxidoreductase